MIDLALLLSLLQHSQRICILPHNNPDPDALASALGLKHLFESLSPSQADILYGGLISRRNNREMVRLLQIPLGPVPPLPSPWYDQYVLVDCQPGMGNNPLPPEVQPLLVVDHHQSARARPDGRFRDIRLAAGSTTAIICEYLSLLELRPTSRLATALYYGIKTDTDSLTRDATRLDREMFHQLFPLIEPETLNRIEKPDLPAEYYHDIGDAIVSARIFGSVLVSDLGPVWSPEMPSEMADFLLRLEGVSTTFTYGLFGDTLHFSLRHSRNDRSMGEVAMAMAEELGSAGGHGWSAGGQLPYSPTTLCLMLERFFALLDIDPCGYVKLFDSPNPPLTHPVPAVEAEPAGPDRVRAAAPATHSAERSHGQST